MGACEKAEKNPVHKKIVDQIVAVDNFVAFKRLMCKRNAELNQQAMKLIEKQATKAKAEKAKREEHGGRRTGREKTSSDRVAHTDSVARYVPHSLIIFKHQL